MSDLKQHILDRIAQRPGARVWTPVDFLDLGSRDAVDKALQRLAHAGHLRRIDRGLYDVPRVNGDPGFRSVLPAIQTCDTVYTDGDAIAKNSCAPYETCHGDRAPARPT